MKKNKFHLILVFALFTFLTLTGQGCPNSGEQEPEKVCPGVKPGDPCPGEISLTIWRLFDDRDVLEPAITSYTQMWSQKSGTKINIEYKKVDYENYEEKLIKALAAGKGPDIFQVHNDWIPKHHDIISPAPSEIITLDEYKEQFVDVAANDFIYDSQIFAMPYSVDTLALYYNNDIFESNRLYSPPETWTEVIEYLAKVNQTSGADITQSGIAIGTANNVNRASDILYALMLQNGTVMTSADNSTATFALPTVTPTGENFYPATSSLDFYTSFANRTADNYSWNQSMPGSIESFEKGQAAMMINYSYMKPTIDRFKDPDVTYSIATLPRINRTDDPISYANYWGEAVSRQSQNASWAWDFINYVAQNQLYNSRTGAPTSLKDKAKTSVDPFEQQAQYAQSFYKIDANKVDQIFTRVIDEVAQQGIPSTQAIERAQNEITNLMIKAKEDALE